jgi:ketosteroid isomerase-like protein
MSNNNNNDSEREQQRNSLEANKLLIKSFVEVLNKQDVTAVDKYYAPDVYLQQ